MKFKDYKNFVTDSVIYGIQNSITNKWYIGSCVNFHDRMRRHYYYLRHNIHHSNKLQRSWNKHGEDMFDIQILKTCTNYTQKQLAIEEELFIKQYDSFHNGYNMTDICFEYHKYQLTQEQKDKRANISKKKVIAFEGKTGELLKIFESVTAASEEYNIPTTRISKCCKGGFTQTCGKVFIYEKDYDANKCYKAEGHGKGVPKSPEHIEKMRHNNRNSRVLYKYDLNKNLIAEYPSRSEAERQNGFKKEGLRYKLDKNLNGFIYSETKYEKDIV